jgi:spore coat polysaccharide biosynthesis predicted glycosyltransferase SpsG
MGHILPAAHIADELNQRGHVVTFISPNYSREKVHKTIENLSANENGQKVISCVTNDDLEKLEMIPTKGSKKRNGVHGDQLWVEFIKKELQ